MPPGEIAIGSCTEPGKYRKVLAEGTLFLWGWIADPLDLTKWPHANRYALWDYEKSRAAQINDEWCWVIDSGTAMRMLADGVLIPVEEESLKVQNAG